MQLRSPPLCTLRAANILRPQSAGSHRIAPQSIPVAIPRELRELPGRSPQCVERFPSFDPLASLEQQPRLKLATLTSECGRECEIASRFHRILDHAGPDA